MAASICAMKNLELSDETSVEYQNKYPRQRRINSNSKQINIQTNNQKPTIKNIIKNRPVEGICLYFFCYTMLILHVLFINIKISIYQIKLN